MKILLRPPMVHEPEAVARLSASLYPERPEPATAWQKAAVGGTDHPHWVVADPADGALMGFGCARPEGAYPPEYRLWRIQLGVAPDRRRQGIGAQLLAQLLDDLRERQALEVRARLRHSSEEAVAFLQKRGFSPFQRMLHLRQELSGLPTPPEEVLPAGLAVTTLREELERNPEAALAGVHDLFCAAAADIPSGEINLLPSLESYSGSLMKDNLLLHDCFFLVKEGDRYVGLSYAATMPDQPGTLGHRFTGVRREYRGRRLARALKVLVTRYALAHGYQRVTTATLEVNGGMRAVNAGLGFTVNYIEERLRFRSLGPDV